MDSGPAVPACIGARFEVTSEEEMVTDVGNVLEIAQLWETEVRDRRTGLGIRFATVPADSLVSAGLLQRPDEIMQLLELEQVSEPLSASLLPYAVASLLQRDEDPGAAAEYLQLVLEHRQAFVHDHPDLLAFSEYVTYANVVPIEHSPLISDSLGNILASGSGLGVGAAVGFMVAGGPTPLLLVTVPAGMILCGSARGIAEGLTEGFRYRIRKLMGVPPDPPPDGG